MIHLRNCSLVLFSLFTIQAFSQSIEIVIPWTGAKTITRAGITYDVPTIDGQIPSNGIVLYNTTLPVKSYNLIPILDKVNVVAATPQELNYINQIGAEIPKDFIPEMKITRAGLNPFLSLSCNPFFIQNNVVKKVESIKLAISPISVTSTPKDFVANSVLETGEWYKISIDKDGIYQISGAFLQSIGIDISNVSPQSIHIFGNGQGSLPELNSEPYIDDLAQCSIAWTGAEDNSIESADYLLFYGGGPHQWYANGVSEFEQRRNAYSDKSYYFIHVNQNIPSKQITTVDWSNGIEDLNVSSYDYRDVYEADLVSLVGGGKRWYGELFDIELSKDFQFSIPNVDVNTPIKFRVSIASNALSAAGTAQKYSVNGSLLYQSSLPVAPYDFNRSVVNFQYLNPSPSINFNVTINRTSPNTMTYLDRILINGKRNLSFYGSQFGFRNLLDTDSTKTAKTIVTSFPQLGFIWDVSDKQSPKQIIGNLQSNQFTFWTNFKYREFVASNGINFYQPTAIGQIQNQNLHGLSQTDYIIVSPASFLIQADRLADLHRAKGLDVHVVQIDQVYNEFSGGAPDPTAIRKLAKMFHDRSIQNGSKMIKYLCLFGDGTYDPKNRVQNNNNFILTYQVDNSENHISALVTDDYFGMLDDNEALYDTDLLDIGIGRLLISDLTQAKQQVDKIEHYLNNGSTLFRDNLGNCCLDDQSQNTFGDWRTKIVQIADDEENGYFINNDTEPQYEIIKNNYRALNCDKLYLDAYPQQTSAGGQRYPDVFEAITDRVSRGALIVNYVGHGGEVGLAEERVVTIPQIQSWQNINALTLFVSATCEFTKYDDPARVSAGELMSLNPIGGAIALMTTTRSVFFGVNSSVGIAFYNNAFVRNVGGIPRTFGEIVEHTKNAALSSDNKRSFTLIGDPALKIALPTLNVVTDSINGNSVLYIDTLSALSKVTVKGHIEDANSVLVSNFNGTLIPTIFDKVRILQTLGQDPGSPVIDYEMQRNILYKGKCTINNGIFEFSFLVPKDIALNFGRGKLSYYGFSNTIDAIGLDTTFIIGGINPNGIQDSTGPQINIFLNDEKFIDGGVTDKSPVLFVKLFDESGINTVGNGIGHDLIAIIDNQTSYPIVLNDYYSSDLNTYQSGQVKFQMETLEEGIHTLSLKAWDVNNNSSESKITFEVKPEQTAVINRLFNYPNPFSTHTEFMLEHNQSCDVLDVLIQVYTISGKLVKTLSSQALTEGFTIRGIGWDGRDDFGDKLANGVYVYRLLYTNEEGKKAEALQKLVILN